MKSVSVMFFSENCDFVKKKSHKFQLYNIFSTTSVLDLGMFQFLSTYEINLELGDIYVDGMLKFSRKSKTGNMLSRSFQYYKSKF